MGRKVKSIALSLGERTELEEGHRRSKSPVFSKRCHIILLKSQQRSSKEIGKILSITDQAVNHWVKRYQKDG
nr:helix-turn-helix domain-containing protein [Flammeovirgaceae bacterium]